MHTTTHVPILIILGGCCGSHLALAVEKLPTHPGWTSHTAINCYEGRGAIDVDHAGPDGTTEPNVGACLQRCRTRAPACHGFTMRLSLRASAGITCWLRAQINITACVQMGGRRAKRFATYVASGGQQLPARPPLPVSVRGPRRFEWPAPIRVAALPVLLPVPSHLSTNSAPIPTARPASESQASAQQEQRVGVLVGPVASTASTPATDLCASGLPWPSRRRTPRYCCAASCGACTVYGVCSARPGGAEQCCINSIASLRRPCRTAHEVGCVLPKGMESAGTAAAGPISSQRGPSPSTSPSHSLAAEAHAASSHAAAVPSMGSKGSLSPPPPPQPLPHLPRGPRPFGLASAWRSW